jgi:hypothetical protein
VALSLLRSLEEPRENGQPSAWPIPGDSLSIHWDSASLLLVARSQSGNPGLALDNILTTLAIESLSLCPLQGSPLQRNLTREHAAPIPLPEATLVPASAPAHIHASTIASNATPRSNPRWPARDNPLSDPHPRLKSYFGMSMLATILFGISMLAIVSLQLPNLAIVRSQTSEPQNHDKQDIVLRATTCCCRDCCRRCNCWSSDHDPLMLELPRD